MDVLSYLLRFLIGGTVVVFVNYLSQIDRPILAGVTVLLPTITLTTYFFLGYGEGMSAVRESIPASLIATTGYFILFAVMYAASYSFNIYVVITLSFGAWLCFTAGVVIYLGPETVVP